MKAVTAKMLETTEPPFDHKFVFDQKDNTGIVRLIPHPGADPGLVNVVNQLVAHACRNMPLVNDAKLNSDGGEYTSTSKPAGTSTTTAAASST